LLATALELFARRGIVDTTLGEIARAAGVTAAMMHYYFKSRDELLDVVIDEHLAPLREQMHAALLGTEEPVAQLLAFAREMVRLGTEHTWFAPLWMREVVSTGGGLRARMEQRFGLGKRDRFVERLARAQREGHLNPALDPRLMVLTLLGLTLLPLATAQNLRDAAGKASFTPDDIARHAVALLLQGAGPAPRA
jgi:AcrR family transcriptional regulator